MYFMRLKLPGTLMGPSYEQLLKFKQNVGGIFSTFDMGISKTFPRAGLKQKNLFLKQMFVYIVGLYPQTHPLEKQIRAMRDAGIDEPEISAKELCYWGIYHLSEGLI